MSIKFVDGSVTAPKGFVASGVHCGIRKNKNKRDLALIYCEKPCTAAAIYTTNLVKSAPILVTRANLENGTAQAVICNSGNANTCNSDGVAVAEKTCALVAKALNIDEKDVIVGSTGVIGQKLPIEPIANSIPELVSALSKEGATNAAEAIMTTDLVKKEYAVETEIGGKTVYIGGIAKGSGMIHPNMATMLCFITTDAAISADMLKIAVKTVADKSFNMVSVDGDTSTNDTLAVMASGLAGNAEITEQNEDYNIFVEALTILCRKLSKEMAKDGSVFTASSTIADWFSRSLADELGRQGVQVSFASTLEQARAANPTYIVTGTITDVWLQEQSTTRVQCTIKAKVALSNKKGVIYSENLSSSQERQFIPSASAIESLLSDTLKDLLVPAAKKIQSQIH